MFCVIDGDFSAWWYAKGIMAIFIVPSPAMWCAHHGFSRACAFVTPAIFHLVEKMPLNSANSSFKQIRTSPSLIKIDVT